MKLSVSICLVVLALVLVGFSGANSPGFKSANDPFVASDFGIGGTAGIATTGSGTGSTTGGSSGGTTGGTTGLPPGNQPWQGLCRIERAEEFKSQTSYTISGGVTQVLTNQHVSRMVLQVAGPPATPPGTTTVMVGGVPTACPWTLDSYSYTVGAVSPAQEGSVISGGTATPAAANVPINSSGGTLGGVSVGVSAYGEVPIQVAATGPFSPPINSTFQVTVGFHIVAHYINPNTGASVPVTSGAYEYYNFNFREMPLQGSSIDTRKVYGQPNLAGEYPADANAPPRNVDFTHWIYTGGCFVGSMPITTTLDQSGLSRMQFWNSIAGSGTCLALTATLLDMGARSNPTGAETVGIFIPAATDPNLNAGPSALTWTGAWSINPSTTRAMPVDYRQTPVATLALTGTNTTDYLNWNIADTYGSGYVIPPAVVNDLCFALTDETTGPSWHYFGTGTYSGIATTFPGTDSQPRLWWVGLTSAIPWSGPY